MRFALFSLILITLSNAFVLLPNTFILKSKNINTLYKSSKIALKLSYLDNLNNVSRPILNHPPIRAIVPIPIIQFDDIFLNINIINNVFLSANSDRVIIFYNNKKGVYYINSKKELNKLEFILSLVKCNIKIIVDYPNSMDNINGPLYCTPRIPKHVKNMTEEEIEDIINDVINRYEGEDEDEDEINNTDEGYEEGGYSIY